LQPWRLFYADDRHAPRKQSAARSAISSLAAGNEGVLSTQVLQEYFVAAIRKPGVPPLEAKKRLRAWMNFEVVTIA